MKAMALFGSQVTGRADAKSDKDLLIVCSLSEKKQYIKEYANYGYSISVYTPEQLNYMKEKGSLFIQHLKHESKIIFDEGNQFHMFLQSSNLVTPSNSELQNCINSINAAIATPNNSILYGWLADHVFVLSRDYLVKLFAQKKQLIFNVNHLRSSLENEFQLNSSESNILLELREAKHAYRNGSNELIMQHKAVSSWIIILQKIGVLKASKNIYKHSAESYLNINKNHIFNSQYELLRYVESLRLLFPYSKCSKNKEILINKLITRPNEYSSTSIKSKHFLNSYLSEFRNKANRVAGGFSPPAPTTPRMRLRTGRFIKVVGS